MPSHAVTIHISNTFIFIELQTYLNHLKRTIFSTGGVRSVYIFKYMCSGFLWCLWSDHSQLLAVFMVYNLFIGSDFISVSWS